MDIGVLSVWSCRALTWRAESLQRSAVGACGPAHVWAPSPSCLQPCYLPPPGVSSEFIVNTLNAGSGALSVTIDGPSKVQLDCRECPEGHVITYTPMAPGNYLIAIKYGGPQHIVGSPFKAKVTGECSGWGASLQPSLDDFSGRSHWVTV